MTFRNLAIIPAAGGRYDGRMLTLEDLDTAAAVVYQSLEPTPQQRWPLLDARAGTPVWVKHENRTPVGAFKIRGGLVYFEALRAASPAIKGVVAATRGNSNRDYAFNVLHRGPHCHRSSPS